jgi:hypothetical protein
VRAWAARLFGIVALLAAAAPASAQDKGDVHTEAGVALYGNNDGLTVASPWIDADYRFTKELQIGLGYGADAITAATVDITSSATPGFRETRHEARADVGVDLRTVRIGGGWVGSWEKDTHSYTAFGSGEVDLFQRNLTVGVGYGLVLYRLGDVLEPMELWRDKQVHQVDGTAAWSVTRTTIIEAGYSFMAMRGFLSNPYLDVPIFPSDPELWSRPSAQWVESRHPGTRDRHTFVLGLRQAAGRRLFVRGRWRGYFDSWAMRSHAVEAGVGVDVGKGIVLEVSDRFHWQSSVSFYRSVYTVNREFITRDRRLGKMMTNMVAVSLRPEIRLGPKKGKIELAVTGEFHWTHYADYRYLDGNELQEMPDTFSGVMVVGFAWDR